MPTQDAGREMDALIAEKVMGFTLKKNSTGWYYKGANGLWPTLLPYSTSIAAAWEVVEYSNAVFEMFNNPRTKRWAVKFEGQDDWSVASTAPLAICLAALKTLEVK